MGYRKHLNIINKRAFKRYSKSLDKSDSLYLIGAKIKGGTTIELNNEIYLLDFNVIKGFECGEYTPYRLSKEDILKIIHFYIKTQIKYTSEKLKKTEVLRDKLTSTDITKNQLSYIHNMLFSFITHLDNINTYFTQRNDKNLIGESELFFLDYFLLIDIYNKFDNNRDIAIISHG